MGTKLLSKICKRTLAPRVASLPTGSYTLLPKEEATLVHEPDPKNLAFTTTWGGKFQLYFSKSYISWDVISA